MMILRRGLRILFHSLHGIPKRIRTRTSLPGNWFHGVDDPETRGNLSGLVEEEMELFDLLYLVFQNLGFQWFELNFDDTCFCIINVIEVFDISETY